MSVDAVLDEVPVGLEVLDHPAQPARAAELPPLDELHELGRPQPRRDLAVGVVEQLVEQVLPALVERELALQLVEHGEARRQAGLDGELEQDAAGERVQRADRGVVEAVEGGLTRVGSPGGSASTLAQAVAQLGGGLLGERDGGDGVDRHALVDEREDAPDERGGLAGAGAGLDEQRRVDVSVAMRRGRRWSGGAG